MQKEEMRTLTKDNHSSSLQSLPKFIKALYLMV